MEVKIFQPKYDITLLKLVNYHNFFKFIDV